MAHRRLLHRGDVEAYELSVFDPTPTIVCDGLLCCYDGLYMESDCCCCSGFTQYCCCHCTYCCKYALAAKGDQPRYPELACLCFELNFLPFEWACRGSSHNWCCVSTSKCDWVEETTFPFPVLACGASMCCCCCPLTCSPQCGFCKTVKVLNMQRHGKAAPPVTYTTQAMQPGTAVGKPQTAAGDTNFASKVQHVRVQLGLDANLQAPAVVLAAEKQLGLTAKPEATLVDRLDAVVATLS